MNLNRFCQNQGKPHEIPANCRPLRTEPFTVRLTRLRFFLIRNGSP